MCLSEDGPAFTGEKDKRSELSIALHKETDDDEIEGDLFIESDVVELRPQTSAILSSAHSNTEAKVAKGTGINPCIYKLSLNSTLY